jgi:hypothetical protein
MNMEKKKRKKKKEKKNEEKIPLLKTGPSMSTASQASSQLFGRG